MSDRQKIRDLPFKLIGASDIKTLGDFVDVASSKKYANTSEIIDEIEALINQARIDAIDEAFNKLGWKTKDGEWGYIDIDREEVNKSYQELKSKQEEGK